MNRLALYSVLFAIACAAPAASAEPPAREPSVVERMAALSLDELFAHLHSSKLPQSAKIYEAEIQKRFNKSGSDTADLLLGWAAEAMNKEEASLALDVLDQLILIKPDFAEAWNKRATVAFMMKDFGASLSDVRRTLALEPRHFGALAGLGIMLEELDREDEAITVYRRALEINPHLEAVRKSLEKLEAKASARDI